MCHVEKLKKLIDSCLMCWLGSTWTGAHSELVVSPVGPSLVNTIAGSNVTLTVSFSGAPDPALTWLMGNLPVVTWTVGSSADPDIANKEVLKIEENGSLTFVNVPLNYTNDYTVEMTKSGLGKAVTNFTLRVFGECLPELWCAGMLLSWGNWFDINLKFLQVNIKSSILSARFIKWKFRQRWILLWEILNLL